MNKEDKNILDEYKEIKSSIESLMNLLKENCLELNEDGDIVDSKTKELILGGNKDE